MANNMEKVETDAHVNNIEIDAIMNNCTEDQEKPQSQTSWRKSLARNYGCSKTAFREEILDRHFEMLESDLHMGDALFHAIQHNSINAVKLICEHLQPSKLAMKTTLNAFADADDLPRYTTPLLYASYRNQPCIVKMLIDFGAEFPCVDAMVSRAGPHHYDCALARLHYYKAISSEAYLLATPDPFGAAVEAGKRIREFEKSQLHSLQKQYRKIKRNLDSFSSKFLMKVDSTEEIKLLLCGGVISKKRGTRLKRDVLGTSQTETDYNANLVSTLPRRVQDAIELNYKQLLTNANCQQYIQGQWYRGGKDWQNTSHVEFTFWSLLVIIFNPIISLLYILLPLKLVHNSIKAPYVRFLLHFSSRASFVILLLYSTVSSTMIAHEIDDDYIGRKRINKYVEYRTRPPEYLTLAIYLMITGMTWREIKELWWLGPKKYFTDWFNWVDICQLLCYWTSIIVNIVDITAKINRLEQHPLNGSQVNQTQSNSLPHIHWEAYETFLISEATFAIATVLTFLAFLRDAVILGFVGPLLVSFIGMMIDIARFLLIYVFVWLSFGIGFTQLYRTFEELVEATCIEDVDEEQNIFCKSPPFKSLSGALEFLFWSLFDLGDLDQLTVHDNPYFTETVGIFLYGVYMLVVVIVMLNALIAMMNNTYTRVEENSDVEWKLSRTKLLTAYMTNSPTLPPPFNIVPTVKTTLWMISCTSFRIRRPKIEGVNVDTSKNHQDSYKELVRLATKRYVEELELSKKESQDQAQMKYDLATLKESLKVIGYDLNSHQAELSTDHCIGKDEIDHISVEQESDPTGKTMAVLTESVDQIREELNAMRAETSQVLSQVQEVCQLIMESHQDEEQKHSKKHFKFHLPHHHDNP